MLCFNDQLTIKKKSNYRIKQSTSIFLLMTKAKFNFNNKLSMLFLLVWMSGVTKSLRGRTRVKCPTLYDVRTLFLGHFLFCPYFVFVFAIKNPDRILAKTSTGISSFPLYCIITSLLL